MGRAYSVTVTTGLNRQTVYAAERLASGRIRRTIVSPSGRSTTNIRGTDGSDTVSYPDGTVETYVWGPDPRWGMVAPVLTSFTRRTPGGLTLNASEQRTAELVSLADWQLQTLTATLTLNGRSYVSVYSNTTRIITTTAPTGRSATVTLDAHGRIVQEQTAGLAPTGYGYDSRGRLVSMTQGEGAEERSMSLGYSSQGYVETLTDTLSRTVHFGYDAAGRLLTQTLPGGRSILYGYDAAGNTTGVTPPGRSVHGFAYTAIDRLSAYSPPVVPGIALPATTYSYNVDRQLTQIARPDGQTEDFGYDGGGRLSTVTVPRGQVSIGYDPATGNVTGLTAPGGIGLSFGYDGALLTSETLSGTLAGSVSRVYDNNWNVTSQSVNGANPIAFQVDADDLSIQAGALSLYRDVTNGLVLSTTLGNTADAWAYNSLAEWTAYTATNGGADLYAVQVARDKLGRITTRSETIQGATAVFSYTYDVAGRLAGVYRDGAALNAYTYDDNGNRLSTTGPGGRHCPLRCSGPPNLIRHNDLQLYRQRRAGSEERGRPVHVLPYDPLGNLMAVTLPDGTPIEYLVDGQNRRIGKKVDGTLVQGFLYQDELKPVAELDGTGTVVSRFIYATRVNVPDAMIKGGVTYRLILDHLGSVRLVVNAASGAIAQRIDYDEFGRVLTDTNPGFQPFGFAGGLYEPATGLVRFGARDYDAETGRWTAKDPIRFAGGDANLYAYVAGDPVNRVDPTGKMAPLVGLALLIVIVPVVLFVFSAVTVSSDRYSEAVQDLAVSRSNEVTQEQMDAVMQRGRILDHTCKVTVKSQKAVEMLGVGVGPGDVLTEAPNQASELMTGKGFWQHVTEFFGGPKAPPSGEEP